MRKKNLGFEKKDKYNLIIDSFLFIFTKWLFFYVNVMKLVKGDIRV